MNTPPKKVGSSSSGQPYLREDDDESIFVHITILNNLFEYMRYTTQHGIVADWNVFMEDLRSMGHDCTIEILRAKWGEYRRTVGENWASETGYFPLPNAPRLPRDWQLWQNQRRRVVW